jgi:beta-lactamase regulating signal transducer with metallopeptidase domain
MPPTSLIATLIQLPMAGAWGSFFAACSALSQQAAAIAITTVWQGAVIACGLAICLRLAPRTSAEYRFAIWAAAFVTLVSLPFVTRIASISAAVEGASSYAAAGAAKPLLSPVFSPLFSIDARWSLLIAALWAATTLYRAIDLAIHSFRLRKLWRDAVPVPLEGNLSDLLAATKATWKRRPVEVCTTTTLQRPSVIGFFKPRILIPDWLFARLTPGELEQIVLHETEHLRRHDDWTNLLQKLCLVLFPLNPALVFIERRLCREREMACDDGVIEFTHAPRAYAACLASLAERGLERRAEALSLGAWQRRPELVHRVHSILRRKHTLGPLGTRALLGALGCSLLIGSVELARCPQLVAFVSVRNQDREQSEAKLSAQIDSQRPSAKLLNASYIAPRSAASTRTSSESRTTKLHAPLRADYGTQSENGQPGLRGAVVNEDIEVSSKTPSYAPNQHSPRPVMLKAKMPSSNIASAQQQQWVVVTTWEQTDSPNQNSSPTANGPTANGLTADYETGPSAEATTTSNAANGAAASADGSVQSKAQRTNQITITRLILKIYPAASLSTQPTLVPMRDGWFVIQL